MRDVLVSIDLETTGLNPDTDQIIEIGAVKFRGDEVIDEFQTLVNPGCPVPPFITQLTGITTEDVRHAPTLREILPGLRRFLGDAPLMAHNVQFDIAFLERGGLRVSHHTVIDTYVLASTLFPDAPRYNLHALMSMLSLPAIGDTHRALNDAHIARELYLKLWERALALPLDTLAEIVRLGEQMPWDGAYMFKAALQARSREVFTAPEAKDAGELTDLGELFGGPGESPPTLRPRHDIQPIDEEELVALVKPNGALSKALAGYEYRSQQVDMLRQVTRAFNRGQHMFIEAPTGVGKSLAYLLPAARFAVQNDARVVISTNTINLQEQLINKDIPQLTSALKLPVRVAVLKGRRNYLCPRRLAALRRRGATTREEMHLLAKILVWLTQNKSGDRNEISLRGPVEAAIWRRLSAEDEGCTTERCLVQTGGTCPFYRARRQAESAHLLIVNHALLLSDVATEGRVLPPYDHLIVDEAHHLEDAITNSMMFRTDPDDIKRQVADLGTLRTGLMGDLLQHTQDAIPARHHKTLTEFVNIVTQASSVMTTHVDRFFHALRVFLETHANVQRNEYTAQVRIIDALRRQPGWSEIEIRWDNLSQFTGAISGAMEELARGLSELAEYDIEDFDDLISATNSTARRLTELHRRLHEIVSEPDGNTIYWAEFQPDRDTISLHAAPLDVGPLVQEHVWFKKDTVIMTSATLRTDDSFEFIRTRLSADDVTEVVVDSPFDYENNTLLYIVSDMPEPNQRDAYQRSVEQGLLELCRATQGRTMVLFTSYAQLRQTANAIAEPLAREGIVVFDQSDGSSRSQLLEGFVGTEKAVLMGTRSFWEGVDVPGADLSVLVIVRLPFSVPSDPLFAARSEQFEDPFNQYAIPETILRFRQGFGRLIRRKDDRGVVVIFDRRVISKGYGQLFLNSLPTCTVYRGRLADLPRLAVRWLERQ
ncbi:MAG TPA: helicase C-terminal domain-containing protein [Aggregatilineales bacterium]|nr:DEAD/DEAH box helicase [Chloroflexota bacterium]HOA25565.1 helicase C-terminal domain-containing protein [Aggregatilineales bacterium]HQA68588.1 helicase C-terminal domain-containing protein [Aggregatilineales bacterium]HQE18365.1 helicase C-terminal domain-containing protein [Aggregatilineales bacterium]